MPCIRCYHNRRKYVLNENGLVNHNPLVGNQVWVEMSNIEEYRDFGGFLDIYDVNELNDSILVKVLNVETYYSDSVPIGQHLDIPSHRSVMGILEHDRVRIVLKEQEVLLI